MANRMGGLLASLGKPSKKEKSGDALLLLGDSPSKGDSALGDDEDEDPEDDSELEIAMEDLASAIESRDTAAMASAFRSAMELV